MTRSFWQDQRATIVLLPSAAEGAALFELAQNWAEVGLLGPALWVTPEKVEFPENQPVKVLASVMGKNRDGELVLVSVDLFEQLARENLRTIRLVKVRSMTPQREFDEIQNRIAHEVERALESVIPSRDVRDSQNYSTDFQILNLIAAPSAHSVKQRVEFEFDTGNTTLVASPEDRSSPWSTDAFIRDGDRFVGFVLMHLATIGGLWNGLPVGTFELFEREQSGAEQVWLSRVFVSTVLTDGLARRVAAQVLQEAQDPIGDPLKPPPGCAHIEDDSKDQYVDSMVDYMMKLDDAILDYRRPPQLEDPEKIDTGLFVTLADFFRFSGNKIVRIPYWAYRYVRGRVSGFVEKKLQGDDGIASVELALRTELLDYHDKTLLDRENSLAEKENQAKKSLRAPVRLSEIRSTPALWSSIREMVFGALDGGSDLSNKGFPLVNTTVRPIFRRVSDLFPHPDESFQVASNQELPEGSDKEIGWENLGDTHHLRSRLEQWQNEARQETDLLTTKIVTIQDQLDDVRETLDSLREALDARGGMEANSEGVLVPISEEKAKAVSQEKAAANALSAGFQKIAAGPSTDAEETTEGDNAPVEHAQESGSADGGTPATTDAEPGPGELGEGADPVGEEKTLLELVQEYRRLARDEEKLVKQLRKAERLAEKSSEREVEREAALEQLLKWQKSNERSLLWKVRERLDAALDTAQSDVRGFQQQLKEIEPHVPGTLIGLRKKFHKRLLITHGIVLLVAGVFAGFGALALQGGAGAVSQARDQILASQTALSAYDPLLGIPTAQNQASYVQNAADISGRIDSDLAAVESALEANPDDSSLLQQRDSLQADAGEVEGYRDALDNVLGYQGAQELGKAILERVAWITPVALAVTLMLLLIPYHRNWSNFRRSVDVQLVNLQRIERGNMVSRAEVERLKSIHKQALDWLKILAIATHTPWRVRPTWLDSGLRTLRMDSLPFAMRVAQAHEGDHSAFATLADSAHERLAQPGWRQRAFERLVTEIGQETGKPPTAFSLEALDNDLPHASNNSRAHLLKNMVSGSIQERVALTFLKPLIEELQGRAMANARPEVFQVEPDALEAIKTDMEGIEEYRKYEPWDEFLRHTLTLDRGGRDPVTALSPLAIADDRVIDGEHQEVMSYALIPEHISHRLDLSDNSGVTYVKYDSQTTRPLDVVLRADMVGPLPLNSLRLMSRADADVPHGGDTQSDAVEEERPAL